MAISSAKHSWGIEGQLTIGAAPRVVKARTIAVNVHTQLHLTRIMPTKDCPLCGGTMKLHERKNVVQVRGNPNATTQQIRGWVCPDCEYFEEADEKE